MSRTCSSLAAAAAAAVLVVTCKASAQATLVSGLGGPVNYGTSCMPPSDDGYWPEDTTGLDLTPAFPNGIHFYGGAVTRAWINNNGSLSFGAPFPAYNSVVFPGASQPIIAPFLADVDTRTSTTCNAPGYPNGGGYPAAAACVNPTSDGVWWSITSGQIVVTWDHVGYYQCHSSPTMAFQLILTVPGPGECSGAVGGTDFDIEFRYNTCGWETGDANGGTGGFGGTPAKAGFESAQSTDVYYALPGSGADGIAMHLCTTSNTAPAQPGVWQFRHPVCAAGQTCMAGACVAISSADGGADAGTPLDGGLEADAGPSPDGSSSGGDSAGGEEGGGSDAASGGDEAGFSDAESDRDASGDGDESDGPSSGDVSSNGEEAGGGDASSGSDATASDADASGGHGSLSADASDAGPDSGVAGSKSGCGCRAAGASETTPEWIVALGLGIALAGARRRKRP